MLTHNISRGCILANNIPPLSPLLTSRNLPPFQPILSGFIGAETRRHQHPFETIFFQCIFFEDILLHFDPVISFGILRVPAVDSSTPNLRSRLPDQLSEMSRFLSEACRFPKVIHIAFIAPGDDSRRDILVSVCEVLAVATFL